MATDPRGLRADAPLLDAWLRFHEQQPTSFTIPGHKHRHDLVGDVVAGDVQPAETVEEARFHQLHRVVELADRPGIAAAQQQRLVDAGLAAIAGDPVGELGPAADAAGGEVRHDGKALVGKPTAHGLERQVARRRRDRVHPHEDTTGAGWDRSSGRGPCLRAGRRRRVDRRSRGVATDVGVS